MPPGVGGLLLASVAGAAFADEVQQADDVDVSVTIEDISDAGVLAMTIFE